MVCKGAQESIRDFNTFNKVPMYSAIRLAGAQNTVDVGQLAFLKICSAESPLAFVEFKKTALRPQNTEFKLTLLVSSRSALPVTRRSAPGGGVSGRPGAVAPRPGARSWRRRATPGRPGLTLTRSVDELDRNPNTPGPPDGLVGDNPGPVPSESVA